MMDIEPRETLLFEFDSKNAAMVENLQQAPASQKRRDAYESHRHRVFALAFYMTGEEMQAEELLAQTFTRVFRKTDEPDGQQVDHSLVTELREHVEFEPVSTAAPPVAPLQPGLSGTNVRRPELEAALSHLPPTERMIFLLRDVESQPVERVATTLELTPAQVNVALFRARLALREALAKIQRGEA